MICTCWGSSLPTPNTGLTSGKPSAIFKHARRFMCMVLGERILLEMWTNCGRIPHLNGYSQRGIDGQVQPGLEEPTLYFHSFTLGCQVSEWIAGKPRTIPGRHSRKREETFHDCRPVRIVCILGPSSKLSPYLLMCPMAVLTVTRGPPSSERRTYGGMMQSSSNTCSTSNSLTSTDLEHLFLKICSQVNLA